MVAVPDTVTVLFGVLTALSSAVIVTVPVLMVAPAAMVRVFALDREKSPTAAFAPGFADTVTAVIALEARSNVAVTVLIPPFSEIDAGDSESVTVGVASSSVRVKEVPVTVPTPWSLRATPDTVMARFASSWALSTAVIATTSEASAVLPAAMTIVESAPTV